MRNLRPSTKVLPLSLTVRWLCVVCRVSCAVCSHYGVSNGAGVMADLPTAHLHKNLTWSGLIEGSAHTFALSEMVRPAHTVLHRSPNCKLLTNPLFSGLLRVVCVRVSCVRCGVSCSRWHTCSSPRSPSTTPSRRVPSPLASAASTPSGATPLVRPFSPVIVCVCVRVCVSTQLTRLCHGLRRRGALHCLQALRGHLPGPGHHHRG
jgi:hypothetical protein